MPIRLLIAEDSQTTREYLKIVFLSAGDFDLVALAADGEEAVKLAREKKPDVVLTDIHMPRMDGYEVTRVLMEEQPCPIVVMSASWKPKEVEMTFQAMEAGALAVLGKPSGPGSPNSETTIRELVQTVRLMAEVPVVRRQNRQARKPAAGGAGEGVAAGVVKRRNVEIVAIGVSTGGPPVLHTILSKLPKDFLPPILIVQHIAEGFLPGLTEWLERSGRLPVRVGRHEERIESGHVYFAPDRLHMGVSPAGRIVLSDTPPEHSSRPSVSHLFRSVAAGYAERAVGVLLTGMGKDGAEELGLIKAGGGVTFAQDEATSVVHGMPGHAIGLGAATHVLPPDQIAESLARLAGAATESDAAKKVRPLPGA